MKACVVLALALLVLMRRDEDPRIAELEYEVRRAARDRAYQAGFREGRRRDR